MISNQTNPPPFGELPASWSNRILILGTLGILFLTLYPFRFNFHVLAHGASPFYLGKSAKSGLGDAVLNVLLFVPFGFGLAEKLRERGKSPRFFLIAVLACGTIFSYTIEFLQFYIPERDSGWEDVFTNGSGSLIGSILYLLFGVFVVRRLASQERSLTVLLTPKRIAYVLMVYFCFWFVLAALMQKQSRLSNWKPDAILVLGNDASGQNPWRGQIQSLQIWDRASTADARLMALSDETAARQARAPIIDYDFSKMQNSTPQLQFVPKLFWIPITPAQVDRPALSLDGKSWLSTRTNAGNLARSLQKTNQFTIHLVCSPDEFADAWGRIVYIADSDGVADVMIRQENTGLGFGFRTPLATRHTQLIWSVPGVFNDHRQRDIIYSYDGANLSLALDGQEQRLTYKLGPGTALARIIRRAKPAELEGNNYIFYAMVFFVGGALLGLSSPYRGPRFSILVLLASCLAFSAAAISLELILDSVSGRTYSASYVVLSVVLGIAGLLWSFADRDLWQNGRSVHG